MTQFESRKTSGRSLPVVSRETALRLWNDFLTAEEFRNMFPSLEPWERERLKEISQENPFVATFIEAVSSQIDDDDYKRLPQLAGVMTYFLIKEELLRQGLKVPNVNKEEAERLTPVYSVEHLSDIDEKLSRAIAITRDLVSRARELQTQNYAIARVLGEIHGMCTRVDAESQDGLTPPAVIWACGIGVLQLLKEALERSNQK